MTAGASVVKSFDEKEREWITHDLGFDKEDTTAADKYFKVTITKIGLVEKAELNEEFFKTVYPDKDVTTTEAFPRCDQRRNSAVLG